MFDKNKEIKQPTLLFDPNIFNEHYFTFLEKNKQLYFTFIRKEITKDSFNPISSQKPSKEFKTKVEETKKFYNEFKKRDNKKQPQENELSLIENILKSIETSNLSNKEKRNIYIPFVFQIFNSLPETQQKLFLHSQQNYNYLKLLLFDTPYDNSDNIIQQYIWFYLFTNEFIEYNNITLNNLQTIFNFLLNNVLYSNTSLEVEQKLEMINHLQPFIKYCLQLYLQDNNQYNICLYMVEIYIDSIVYQILLLSRTTEKTTEQNYLAFIWQLILEVFFPYLLYWVDLLPKNEGLIQKVLLCLGSLRAYYGNLGKIKQHFDTLGKTSDSNTLKNIDKNNNEVINCEFRFENMLDWKCFKDNLELAIIKFLKTKNNYCSILIDILKFFFIHNKNVSQKTNQFFTEPTYFNNYYTSLIKDKEEKISKENLFPQILNENNYINFYQDCLNLYEIKGKSDYLISVIKKITQINSKDKSKILDLFPSYNIFNIYSGIIMLLNKLLYLSNNEHLINTYNLKMLIILNQLLNFSKKVEIIPVIEILEFTNNVIQNIKLKEEISVVVDILKSYKNNISQKFVVITRIHEIFNNIFDNFYTSYIQKNETTLNEHAETFVDFITHLINCEKYLVSDNALKLYCYFGMNFGSKRFETSFNIIQTFFVDNSNQTISHEVIYDLLNKWKEMIIQGDSIYKKQFKDIEKWICSSFVNVFEFILIKQGSCGKDNRNKSIIDLFIDFFCELIVASNLMIKKDDKKKSNKYNYAYEYVINKLFKIKDKMSKKSIEKINQLYQYNKNIQFLYKEILQIIMTLLYKLNQIKCKEKMNFLTKFLFLNKEKLISFDLQSEILSHMYINKDNKIYFEHNYLLPSSINSINEPCLYGTSDIANQPPDNVVFLDTNSILLNMMKELFSNKQGHLLLNQLKFFSTALSHIYLLNDNIIETFFKKLNEHKKQKDLFSKETTPFILQIFINLISLLKSGQNNTLNTSQMNIKQEKVNIFFLQKDEQSLIIIKKYFKIITSFLTDSYEMLLTSKKEKHNNSLITNLPLFFGSISYYLNSLLIDKKTNYSLSILEVKNNNNNEQLKSYVENYITLLLSYYIDITEVNLTLPLLYSLFMSKEFIVAFTNSEIKNFFWLCFAIRWPKYSTKIISKFIVYSSFKFNLQNLVSNLSFKIFEPNDQIKVNYLSECLCYYYLQYLVNDIKTENELYNEIINIFLNNEDNNFEDSIYVFLDYCQSILFNKDYVRQSGLNEINKDKIINNVDSLMIFSSNIETILIHNENINKDNSNENIEKEKRLNIIIISPSTNTSLMIEDYWKFDQVNNETKSWQVDIKHLLFDISNFTSCPDQLFTHINNIKEGHKQSIINLLSKQIILLDIPILFVPFSTNVLNKTTIFPLDKDNYQKPLLFCKFISLLGTITQNTKESLIITNKNNLFTINFNILTKEKTIENQIEIVKNCHIHIIYLENEDQPLSSFDNLYENDISKEQNLYIYIIVTNIGQEYFLIRRRYNNNSLINEYLDKTLANNYVINLYSDEGLRYFINSIILLNEMNIFQVGKFNVNKLMQRYEIINAIDKYYIENKEIM